jgi:hypothetical protein
MDWVPGTEEKLAELMEVTKLFPATPGNIPFLPPSGAKKGITPSGI